MSHTRRDAAHVGPARFVDNLRPDGTIKVKATRRPISDHVVNIQIQHVCMNVWLELGGIDLVERANRKA